MRYRGVVLRAKSVTTVSLCAAMMLPAYGCVGVGHDLHAVTELYHDARYEVAQAWFAVLSVEYADMTASQRTTFHYLSGMTAHRLSQPQEALHELALAAHGVREQAAALDAAQLAVLYRTLEELSPVPSASSAPSAASGAPAPVSEISVSVPLPRTAAE